MPPTFLLFLAIILYIGLTTIALLVFVPMLFIKTKKLLAKKVIATVLISLPCLLVAILLCCIVFLIPAIVFFWFVRGHHIPLKVEIFTTFIGLLVFAVCVAASALYLWSLTSKLIYCKLDERSVSEILEKDKIFTYFKLYLIKYRLCQ